MSATAAMAAQASSITSSVPLFSFQEFLFFFFLYHKGSNNNKQNKTPIILRNASLNLENTTATRK